MPIEILMPALSPTMTEGNLAKWVKKEGDSVKPGDVIAEIETDKATMEVEAVDEGIIGKILVKEGAQGVAVNQAIALLLIEGEDKAAIKDYKPAVAAIKEEPKKEAVITQSPVTQSAPAKSPAPSFSAPPVFTPSATQTTTITHGSDVKASPLAKRLAKEAGVDIGSLVGTGPRGRIIKADIEDAKRSGGAGGRVMRNPAEVTAVPNDNMRKVIASRLLQSKQYVPHFYLNIDCVLDKLLDVRKDLNDAAYIDSETGKPAYKLSVNDLVIKAVAKALKKVPEANATWTDEATLLYNNVDISVAVAIDGGLITPIVKNADQKSLPIISNEMKDLAARAKIGKLAPAEFQGGGFSISNLGMYGVKDFSAIINPPQGCILAIGAGELRPIVKDGRVVSANVMTVTLSCDHRVVDGAVGAQFLAAFKEFVERPVTMLV
ncbi:MAG: pdhC [Rickettsiaceae bacterium]|jgi:pyruvate dehydrogenase E2 component (dihydrolipoamide acetyltransferase)|nr:pdhC [Rickettsiaceae bacterium]